MASFNEEDLENEDYEDDSKDLYGVRDGILFLIDATPPMFKNDPQNGIPYFLQCIKQYKEILKQKLVWNRQDWMGLILFGTEKYDSDSETKNILILKKLNLISKDDLKDVMKIDEGKTWEYYRDNASSTSYPLHDVLWHAIRAFSAVHITMPMKRVILFTCQDNPSIIDDNEKHRIRVKATSYSDIDIQLSIVGLGENWNHDLFYKDLEMLSGKIEADDYKRTSLKDLVEQVKLPSRNMAKLPWRLGENVTIDVSLRNLSVKTQYLHKENISKQTNIPLTTRTYFKVDKDDIMTEEIDDIENKRTSSSVLEMDIRKYQNFGLEKIYFTQAEVRSLSTMREPGIDLICIKHISYHLLYHVETPYFVIPSKSNRKDNKLLFGALLNKCDSKKLMIICAVTIRSYSASSLYTMIPNVNNGGFYLYKMPFRENVRDLSEYFSEFIYNHNERKPPIEPNAVELLKNIMKKLNIEYNPKLFSNPKLQVQLQIVETLALDLEQFKSLPDDTFPKTEEIHKLVKDLLDEYDKIFNEETEDNIPKKKRKNVRK
ncbi:X-ray repair cross-complementing protein 6-like isoform X1 [Apis laboriosa]|uniref:X-ray repair cross-complementing protein 6-like isoform X1 n=1 Tax=Apis laboriosa TaxID=183418 RepID=UPI001CC5DFD7|nr:X-ray repair cross-complementing protein 6-like isoform X1 [Apis laboriosa]XP_043790144.1 X-ray repair cross-complementing protein 6-like isoform X1 [Apis laboriosa]